MTLTKFGQLTNASLLLQATLSPHKHKYTHTHTHKNIGRLSLLVTSYIKCGPGSSVGVATDYGLDGPGSNPSGDEIFRPSRPALGPTQSPVHNAYRVFPDGKVRPGRAADHSPPSSAAVMV